MELEVRNASDIRLHADTIRRKPEIRFLSLARFVVCALTSLILSYPQDSERMLRPA